ncbi:hypothetical protein ACFQHV_04620 [Promicromonospora thailandica]|uniref:Uncharacterized protein n=1 Tax=Promicromonospora thailandica TaxID=765201 RepID=A0A9X2G9U9_9MICO|nr:hypothetical protein [Promicromonospora thailandica]MCP2265809.1 hypothetical protein [Promicromonospora thailandica]BFF21837.1 hypothetical protein GCM10025730_53580 [Promicromonospora thailandica]
MAERRYRAGVVALLVLALCASGGVAWAWWSVAGTAQAPPVASGRLDLTGGPATGQEFLVGPGGTWSYPVLTLPAALPGESVARAMVLRAGGTTDLTVSGTVSAESDVLGPDLLVTVTRDGAPSNTTVDGLRTGTCSGTTLVTRQPVGTTPSTFLPGTFAAAETVITLCVVLGLDSDAPSSVQNQTTTVAFAVSARQAAAP